MPFHSDMIRLTGAFDSQQCDVLELDQMPRPLAPFPLLAAPSQYFPDSVDLSADSEARSYWLTCFDEALDKVCLTVRATPCKTTRHKFPAELGAVLQQVKYMTRTQ